ncbi:hypothetical protein Q7P36_000693 [Cladosporium allicinum]
MVRYRDILSDDYLRFNASKVKDIDGAAFEVEGAWVSPSQLDSVDVSFLEDRDITLLEDDDEEEAASKSETKIIDIIAMNDLQKTFIQQKDLTHLLHDYAKAVRHALGRRDTPTDEIKAFGNSVIAYLKDHLIPEFDRYEFYTVPSYRSNSLIVPLRYREDGKTPYIVLWKHSLVKAEDGYLDG